MPVSYPLPRPLHGQAVDDIHTTAWTDAIEDHQARVLGLEARGIVATPKQTTTAAAATPNTEVKDTLLGDYTFTASAGRRYKVVLVGRIQASAASTTGDIRIRDGGEASPTASSTVLTGASYPIVIASGPGALNVHIAQTMTLEAGTHTIAVFYIRTAGTGNVLLDSAVGQTRELYVEDMGPA